MDILNTLKKTHMKLFFNWFKKKPKHGTILAIIKYIMYHKVLNK